MSRAPAREAARRGWLMVLVAVLCVVFVYAAAAGALLAAFLWAPYANPSGAMMPALLAGDWFLVSKVSYPYRYALPAMFSRYFPPAPPERGDVAVFKLPRDNETDYVKRIVGLPGDRVQVKGGVLHINGEPVKRERIEDLVLHDAPGNAQRLFQYLETLPNGRRYRILEIGDDQALTDDTQVYAVPPKHLFAMGDNRDNSQDSRFLRDVGYVPMENLVGRATTVFFSADGTARWWEFWRWPFAVRYNRLFRAIT
ncbi:MAG: signal peptidase I [Rhodospirillales bacterium]